MVSTAKFNKANIAAKLEEGFLDATSLAEYLTTKSIPFRKAHGIVGKLVAKAESKGMKLADFSLAELQRTCKFIDKDVSGFLGAENVVKRYSPEGSGGPKQLKKQLSFWNRKLNV